MIARVEERAVEVEGNKVDLGHHHKNNAGRQLQVPGGTFGKREAFMVMMRTTLFALALVLAAAPAAGRADSGCSSEVLRVRDVPVTVRLCVTGSPTQSGPELTVAVEGQYSAPGGSFSRTSTMHFVSGEGAARVLENVDLSGLGLTGTLHLTLSYASGLVKVENAMLTPGALTIK